MIARCAFRDGLWLGLESQVAFEYGFTDSAFLIPKVRLQILVMDLQVLGDDLIYYPYCAVYYSI